MQRHEDAETLKFMEDVLSKKRFQNKRVMSAKITQVANRENISRGMAIQRLFCEYVAKLLGFCFADVTKDKEDNDQSSPYEM